MNVLYHTSFRNYASISLQVPSNISILLGQKYVHCTVYSREIYTIYTIQLSTQGRVADLEETPNRKQNNNLFKGDPYSC
jgi:hypothetical protein